MHARLLLCLAASWFVMSALVAQAGSTHEGKVVSIEEGTANSDGKLVMTDKDGKDEHRHAISSNVKIMRDNKPVKLSDLKKGDSITVTTGSDGKVTELAVDQTGGNKNSDQTSQNDKDTDQDYGNRFNERKGNELPDYLTNLNLTSEQKDKIKAICSECEQDRENAWHRFNASYREAIEIEASMMAAIEENLTEAQRKHIRNQRERIARRHNRHERRHESARNESDKSDKTDTTRNETAKSDTNKSEKSDTNKNDSNNQNDVVVEEITIVGVNLSPDQESTAEELRGSYSRRLHKLNRRISELHAQLVSMEVERLLKIEDILTKEQRQQLRKEHQNMDNSAVRTSHISGGAK